MLATARTLPTFVTTPAVIILATALAARALELLHVLGQRADMLAQAVELLMQLPHGLEELLDMPSVLVVLVVLLVLLVLLTLVVPLVLVVLLTLIVLLTLMAPLVLV
ncbi:MAG: hypothetical protein VYD05_01235, partial [Planctomycetota bacterium]|nr:hypothetical protein [Planctomycetota bacterium]